MATEMLPVGLMARAENFPAQLSAGRPLFVAGDERVLRGLPKGDWVGGTSAYFISEEGGLHSRDRLSVVAAPEFATGWSIKVYDAASVAWNS